MKKTVFGFLSLAAIFCFTSCEEMINTIDEFTDDELVGEASVVISRIGNGETLTDSLTFSSSVVDALDVSRYDQTLPEGYFTLDISANIDFNTSNVELQYPFMLFRLDDTVAQSYTLENILTVEMLSNLDLEALVNIIATPDGPNMLLIAENDSCWYLTFGGQLVVTEYPTIGNLVKAGFNGVNGRYITQSKIDELNSDIENNNFAHLDDLNYYFPEVTLSGNIVSRRWAVARTVYEAAFVNGGLISK